MKIRVLRALLIAAAIAGGVRVEPAAAQADDSQSTRASFSLSSSRIVTSHETPAIYLTYRRLDHLDFRVYRVSDPVTFLAGLKDPHQLGSEEPLVRLLEIFRRADGHHLPQPVDLDDIGHDSR